MKQDVFLHIWGETSPDGLAYAMRLLSSDAERFNMPDLAQTAMRPGGVRIREFPLRKGDGAYPIVLNDAGFSKVGLSMAWLTAPWGETIRGSHLTHAGLSAHLHVRTNPTRNGCDLVRFLGDPCNDMDRMATALIRLAPHLGVKGVMSAHEEIGCSRALDAAIRATSADDLENALKLAMISTK